MNAKPNWTRTRCWRRWTTTAAVVVLGWTSWAGAQAVPAPTLPAPSAPPAPSVIVPSLGAPSGVVPAVGAKTDDADSGVIQARCTSCGAGLLGGSAYGIGGCPSCGGCGVGGCGSNCVPGRTHCCSWVNQDTFLGRCLGGLYCCVCCPDPCYEPGWIAAANAAFFVDGARPVTHMRIRWDAGLNFRLPDRSEFFWGRIGVKGPGAAETGLRYNDLALYTETAIGPAASFFVEFPYRSLDPEVNNHAAGFADMNLGTKAVLFDCELLQVTFQFRTYLPMGNFNKGLGVGHVSLEPSLLTAVKLTHSTYLQGQLSEWIPIAGDQDYAGSVLHYHFSLNQVLWRILPDVLLIGTFEFNGYSFQDGAFTDPVLGPFQKSSGETYISIGPGLRLVICDKLDIGLGTAFTVDGRGGPEQLYRTEFRWRF